MDYKAVFALFSILAFAMSFVAAQTVVNPVVTSSNYVSPVGVNLGEVLIISADPTSTVSTTPIIIPPVRTEPFISITPLTPADDSVFTTTSSIDISFTFLAEAYGFIDADLPITCSVFVNSDSGEVMELDALLDDAAGNLWNVNYEFREGNYNWIITCNSKDNNYGQSWATSSWNFTVDDTTNNGGNNNGGSSGGGSNNGSGRRAIALEQEEGGRKKATSNELPLTNLSNTNTNTNSNQQKSFSGITGAVVGVLGEKGALWFGVFLVIVGVAGLFIYNRARFGIVKAK